MPSRRPSHQTNKSIARSVKIAKAKYGRRSSQACAALNDYAIYCKEIGRFEQADKIYRSLLRVYRSAEQSLDRATVYHNLGGLEHARGRFARGEPWARKGVKIRTRLLGSRHASVAADEVALGAILDGRGKHREAQRLYRHALRIFRAAKRPDVYEIAVTLNNLAASCHATGARTAAARFYQEALDLKEELLGRKHISLAVTLNNMALLFESQKKHALARAHLKRALAILQSALPPAHPQLRICQKNYAKLARDSAS
jgi:tetratricopeptide (TPR) repeat protein